MIPEAESLSRYNDQRGCDFKIVDGYLLEIGSFNVLRTASTFEMLGTHEIIFSLFII